MSTGWKTICSVYKINNKNARQIPLNFDVGQPFIFHADPFRDKNVQQAFDTKLSIIMHGLAIFIARAVCFEAAEPRKVIKWQP